MYSRFPASGFFQLAPLPPRSFTSTVSCSITRHRCARISGPTNGFDFALMILRCTASGDEAIARRASSYFSWSLKLAAISHLAEVPT